jgi:hypothetical protein
MTVGTAQSITSPGQVMELRLLAKVASKRSLYIGVLSEWLSTRFKPVPMMGVD